MTLDGEVVRKHQESVWRYLRFLGCPAQTADDLTQETFLALLHARVEDRGAAALDGWLRGVARNLFRESRRALRRGLETLDPTQIESTWAAYARDDDGGAYHAALRTCLATLDERARRVLELRYREDATRSAIASALGIGEEGAKTILRRAKDRLRKCIERRLDHEPT